MNDTGTHATTHAALGGYGTPAPRRTRLDTLIAMQRRHDMRRWNQLRRTRNRLAFWLVVVLLLWAALDYVLLTRFAASGGQLTATDGTGWPWFMALCVVHLAGALGALFLLDTWLRVREAMRAYILR